MSELIDMTAVAEQARTQSESAVLHPWFAVRVRSNFESTADLILQERGHQTFLPKYRSRRRWSDRVVDLDLPLFPGYLFCRVDTQVRLPLLMTPGVVGLVGVGKIPQPVSEEEVTAVRAILGSDLTAQPWPFLRTGQWVRIERGPLTGVEGVLEQVKGRYRLVVSISLLQRSVAAEIDRDLVRPIDRPVGGAALGRRAGKAI